MNTIAPDPLRLIFAGSGEFGLPTLAALVEDGHSIELVVTQPDRPAGRGRKLTPTPIGQFALKAGLPLIRTDNVNALALPQADALVVIAFGQKIAEHVVNAPRYGAINLHASRLPLYRGAAPVNRAILGGERVTGNSVIRLANRMDAGAILHQSQLVIGETETAGELHDRLAADGPECIRKVLQQLHDGAAVEIEQNEAKATAAPKLSRVDSQIDFSRPAVEVARQIRGMYPWPGCRVSIVDAAGEAIDRLTLVRAVATGDDEHRWATGEVTMRGTVCCGEGGAVELLEVKPEGKPAMPMEAYRRGHRWMAGLKLISIA